MTTSPAVITPPMVWTESWCTMPLVGARRSTRLSKSCAAVRLFNKLGLLVLGFAQILHDLRAKIVIDPDGLELGLADLGFRLRNRCRHLTALAVETGGLALQRCLAGQGHQSFLVQAVHALEFARDQVMLGCFRFYLSVQTRNLLAELPDMAVQELLGGAARRRTAVEQRSLRCPQSADIRSPDRLAISCGICGWSKPSRSAIRRASLTRI